jgi:acetoacetyl-CoA synthetase
MDQVSSRVQVSSISGGSDIISCFMLGNPWLPVYPGEIQGPGLGMAIAAYDEEAAQVVVQQKGELICTQPFVSQPLGFLHDPQGERFYHTYFRSYPSTLSSMAEHPSQLPPVWVHGDYIEVTSTGGVIVLGRSDATLNPGGIRMGTAEFYRLLETLACLEDSLAFGWQQGPHEEIVLLVCLKNDQLWGEDLKRHIQTHLRQGLSPKHVPQHIYPVTGIPYTPNGKKMELAAKHAWQGQGQRTNNTVTHPDTLTRIAELGQRIRGGL